LAQEEHETQQDETAPAADAPAEPVAAAEPDVAAPGTAAEPGEPAVMPDGEAASPVEPALEGSVLPPAEIRAVLEALIFASDQPITAREIGQVLGAGVPREDWEAALGELKEEYGRDGRGLQLAEIAGGWQITTRPEYNDWVRELLDPQRPTRLSIQALETLAVIAYKQPVTQPEVIELRGVKSGGVVKTLLEKRLIRITGRKEVVGRPMLYGTTKEFLLHFGLKDLSELPKIEEFAEVLGEEVDVAGLKRAIEAPLPVEVPLTEEGEQMTLDQASADELADETVAAEASDSQADGDDGAEDEAGDEDAGDDDAGDEAGDETEGS
jgi:segregation and condensation protein B